MVLLTLILGGSKVSDKIGVIENMVKKCDYILVGGGMAYTFLSALGYNIGESLLDSESIDFCIKMLDEYKDKIILPIDSKVEDTEKDNASFMDTDKGLDIGSKTIELFKNYIEENMVSMEQAINLLLTKWRED